MNTKTLLMGFAFLAVMAGSPFAMAASKEDDSSSVDMTLDQSDEEFLKGLAEDPSSAAYKAAKAAGNVPDVGVEFKKEEEKPPVKYIYKGQPIGQLRRTITDDRIDDGYVQGLMQQRGPK